MIQPSEREIEVFNSALELPVAERAAYLDQVCAADISLRQRVEELLKLGDDAGGFLQGPSPASAEKPGDRIGRYKLLQQIGEGGCGVVYMAEQEEPVRRKVALKVIKLGMDTKSVIARFEAERQALALMDHPNIAKVLDVGATGAGRPYFVMELVRGIKITDYCDQNSLATGERLDLFVQVCRAVQHAHQKGVIHRDIKPSNILVTLSDGVALPKLIDFGIAKATQGKLTDQTLFTAFEQFIGTPAYMSPEQAQLSAQDIDTRSDIYSLGVLLYELLTGRTPFDTKELLQAGLDEIRRTIRHTEPPRPSTRLSTMLGSDLAAIAKARRIDPPRLIHLVRGDLDWIVMKALEKDRARRYETVSGLALDIQRHLENQPITARPPSGAYRFRKLIRRNKFAFAVAALIGAVLVAATATSAWQAIRATRAEKLAARRLTESESARNDAEAVSKFLTEVFRSPSAASNPRSITGAEMLANAAKKLDTELTNQPALRATLETTLGRSYYSLGLYRESIPLQESAFNYLRTSLGRENPDTLRVMNDLITSYSCVLGFHNKAVALSEQMLAIFTKLKGPDDPTTISTKRILAIHYYEISRRDEAIEMMEEVLAHTRRVKGPEDKACLLAMNLLGLFYRHTGRAADAIKMSEETLALSRKVNGPEDSFTLASIRALADSYDAAGRKDEALNLREQVVPLCRKVLGSDHPATLRAMKEMADSYEAAGRRNEALELRETVLPLVRKVDSTEDNYLLDSIVDLAVSCQETNRWGQALKLWQEALPLSCEFQGSACPGSVAIMGNLATCLVVTGRGAEAVPLQAHYCELNPTDTDQSLTLAAWQAWFGKDADYEATRQHFVQIAQRGKLPETADRAAKAACLRPSTNAELLANALALAQRAVDIGKTNSSLPWFELALGLAEYRNGHYAAAEQALTISQQTVGDDNKDTQATARLFHAMSLFRQNRTDEAQTLFNQAKAQMTPYPKDESQPLIHDDIADHDTLILWLAYKEARELLADTSAPK